MAALAEETVRASSLVENLNSRLRSYFFLRRHLGADYLALLQFYLNHRRLERSDRPEPPGEDTGRALDWAAAPALAGDARLQPSSPRLSESSRRPTENLARQGTEIVRTCYPKTATFEPGQNPLRTVPMAQHRMGLCQGVRTAALPPKAIGMAVGQGFRDGIEAQQVQCLHGSIGHGGDAPSALPLLPNRLWDSSPSPIHITLSVDSASRSFVSVGESIRISSSDSPTDGMPPSP